MKNQKRKHKNNTVKPKLKCFFLRLFFSFYASTKLWIFCTVPKVFAIVFNIVKRFLDEYTLGKILIFKQDSKKWLPKMLEHVDASQIPKYFGGTQTDEDGDPKCLHKVTKRNSMKNETQNSFLKILKKEMKRKRKK